MVDNCKEFLSRASRTFFRNEIAADKEMHLDKVRTSTLRTALASWRGLTTRVLWEQCGFNGTITDAPTRHRLLATTRQGIDKLIEVFGEDTTLDDILKGRAQPLPTAPSYPWSVRNYDSGDTGSRMIVDARGVLVAGNVSPTNAELIVAAVNSVRPSEVR